MPYVPSTMYMDVDFEHTTKGRGKNFRFSGQAEYQVSFAPMWDYFQQETNISLCYNKLDQFTIPTSLQGADTIQKSFFEPQNYHIKTV